MNIKENESVLVQSKENKWYIINRKTYSEPPPAGPTALKRDTAVIATPLAAPLWFRSCSLKSLRQFVEDYKLTNHKA
jgi:hypothetical protein